MVNVNGTPTEEVIDHAFLKKPETMQTWTHIFMEPKTVCPSVDHYSDYSKHQEDSYCYVIKTSMYFWQPRNIQALETGTPAKTAFIQADVNYAYKQGFE
jgi:hypothetical protein